MLVHSRSEKAPTSNLICTKSKTSSSNGNPFKTFPWINVVFLGFIWRTNQQQMNNYGDNGRKKYVMWGKGEGGGKKKKEEIDYLLVPEIKLQRQFLQNPNVDNHLHIPSTKHRVHIFSAVECVYIYIHIYIYIYI